MDNTTQLEFLRTKYVELSRQYLAALREGNSVAYIKDLSYVLECLSAEIEILETENRILPGDGLSQRQQPAI